MPREARRAVIWVLMLGTLAITLAIVMAGCAARASIATDEPSGWRKLGVRRVIDEEAGVVCYIGFDSISCVPLRWTLLDY